MVIEVIVAIVVLGAVVVGLRTLTSRQMGESEDYLEGTYGSNRRPYGYLFHPRYLQRFTREEPDDRP